jgi:asparagine synthase (glutamine-hydrolysing)
LVNAHFDARARAALLGGSHFAGDACEVRIARSLPPAANLVDRATRHDFHTYLPDDILVKVDRASMLASLELRAPLLDHRVIEFAYGRVPTRLKATATQRKILLKRLAARVLPPAFDRQRKQGFSIPLARWLQQGAWRELFHDVLRAPGGLFEPRAVQALLRGQDAGRQNYERLFGLVLLELWRREYRCTI